MSRYSVGLILVLTVAMGLHGPANARGAGHSILEEGIGSNPEGSVGFWYVAERVSVSSSGVPADSSSIPWSISADGRYIAFDSYGSNLVAGDTYQTGDVFVRDHLLGTTERVSVGIGGADSNGSSARPSVSADGRYVAFHSWASNLVPGDTNGEADPQMGLDVFVHDRLAGTTERVSVSSAGVEGNSQAAAPSISADGRYVAFSSSASNLVADDTNGFMDVFVRDRVSATTVRVSLGASGDQANSDSQYPAISGDGRYVAFTSSASNLVAEETGYGDQVFVRDMVLGTTVLVSVSGDGEPVEEECSYPSISTDGRYVTFTSRASNLVAGDSNGTHDVFVRDLVSGTTERVSVSSEGEEANRESGSYVTISGDGRYVAFDSWASNLVDGDTNNRGEVFVRDRTAGLTRRASVTSTGVEPDDAAEHPVINAHGDHIAFDTWATNLVEDTSPRRRHVYLAKWVIFVDSDGSVFESDIEWLATAGITKGCNPPYNTLFCPNSYVTRGQMAAFLARALDLTDDGGGDLFGDDDGSVFESAIDKLATAGITKGCNPSEGNTRFCPHDYVTRGQMAAFLVRAMGYTDDGGGDLYEDDDGNIFESAIDKLGTAGVTRGCNPVEGNTKFCPHDYVTRGQMAAFLKRALG